MLTAFFLYRDGELLSVENPHLVFLRTHPERPGESVLVAANLDVEPRYPDLSELGNRDLF